MKFRTSSTLALLTLASFGLCQDHFRFVVTGDDRWNTNHPRAGLDENGVNVTAMKRLAKAIIDEKPTILLFNGDCVGGMKADEDEASQFTTFMQTMKPIYDAGVKVLVIRGNHEMHAPHSADIWRKVFAGPYANPGGGPAGEEDLTYAYTYGN